MIISRFGCKIKCQRILDYLQILNKLKEANNEKEILLYMDACRKKNILLKINKDRKLKKKHLLMFILL